MLALFCFKKSVFLPFLWFLPNWPHSVFCLFIWTPDMKLEKNYVKRRRKQRKGVDKEVNGVVQYCETKKTNNIEFLMVQRTILLHILSDCLWPNTCLLYLHNLVNRFISNSTILTQVAWKDFTKNSTKIKYLQVLR